MKYKEALKIKGAFERLLNKMAKGDTVDIPTGGLFKAGKGIAISSKDYETLYPFLFSTVEMKVRVGDVTLETGYKVFHSVTFSEDEVFLLVPYSESFEYIETFVNLGRIASSVLKGTAYKKYQLTVFTSTRKGPQMGRLDNQITLAEIE